MSFRSVTPLRTAKIAYIAISALACALGLALIIWNDISVSVLGVIIGVLMIVSGLVRMAGYFSRDLYRLAFQYDLPFGLLLTALGVLVLFNPEGLMTFICITSGVCILADGLFKMQMSFDAKRFGLNRWWLILLCAILAGVCGLLLILRPVEGAQAIMILFGITLLFEGIMNILTAITAVKIIKTQKPDIIDVEYTDESER